MKLVIDVSEYNKDWINNTYGIPQDIDVGIAEAIMNGDQLVKCKNCANHIQEGEYWYCNAWKRETQEDWFCSRGNIK